MNKLKLDKQKMILYGLLTLFLISLIIGIVLTVLGTSDYGKFVDLTKQLANLQKDTDQYNSVSKMLEVVNISKFIYGIFLLIISLLLLIFSSLSANSIFNKKLR
ncbi:hypothetical protein ACXX84_02470 [Mycoplasma sp. AC157]